MLQDDLPRPTIDEAVYHNLPTGAKLLRGCEPGKFSDNGGVDPDVWTDWMVPPRTDYSVFVFDYFDEGRMRSLLRRTVRRSVAFAEIEAALFPMFVFDQHRDKLLHAGTAWIIELLDDEGKRRHRNIRLRPLDAARESGGPLVVPYAAAQLAEFSRMVTCPHTGRVWVDQDAPHRKLPSTPSHRL